MSTGGGGEGGGGANPWMSGAYVSGSGGVEMRSDPVPDPWMQVGALKPVIVVPSQSINPYISTCN